MEANTVRWRMRREVKVTVSKSTVNSVVDVVHINWICNSIIPSLRMHYVSHEAQCEGYLFRSLMDRDR